MSLAVDTYMALKPKRSQLQAWLSYLESNHPKTIDLGLDRIKIVAARLAVLTLNCPVITVAGTNGKGSCVALTQAILAAAGYRVASYTSPHLIHYNERIQIDAKPVSDRDLCEAFTHIEEARAEVSLSYFEVSTLAALLLFKRAQPDVIILEVGLGGRLDAVNCIDADISIISTIDLDHMDWLGTTREHIAKEKAGIMRTHKPCVIGDFSFPVSIQAQAIANNVPLYLQGQQFDYKKQTASGSWSWQSQHQQLTHLPLPNIELQNAATVLQVIELINQQFPTLAVNRHAIDQGLKQVFISGRFQIIQQEKLTLILDVAHNPAGARCVAKRLVQEPCFGKTYAVVGMLANKDISNTLAPLISHIDQFYLADLNLTKNETGAIGASAAQLARHLMPLSPDNNVLAGTFPSPVAAFQAACENANAGDRILVLGSFHTVGSVLATLI